MRILGYAIRWSDEALVAGRRERFERGAFSAWLARGGPCALTLDHNGPLLASSSFGTLRLAEDARGLLVVADLRHAVGVNLSPVRSGALNGMSLGFTCYREEMRDRTRVILEAMASEIAIVSAPAYRQSRFVVCAGAGTREVDSTKEMYRVRLAIERQKLRIA